MDEVLSIPPCFVMPSNKITEILIACINDNYDMSVVMACKGFLEERYDIFTDYNCTR